MNELTAVSCDERHAAAGSEEDASFTRINENVHELLLIVFVFIVGKWTQEIGNKRKHFKLDPV